MTKIKREETKISVLTRNSHKKSSLKINLKIFNGFVFASIVFLGVSYIMGANSLTVKGFELMDLKKNAREINNENGSLETRITALDSYNGLDEKIKDLGMVSVAKVDYIENKADVVAKK